jgi:aspartyl-tRNA(Asn)/glutamyl-tRNA(Gln) amidotransferase subunit A
VIAREILEGTLLDLARRIRKREISPVAVTEAYLERSATTGKRLNAYATLMPERALAEAREAEKEIAAGRYRGVLHGIPYAAKDLLAAKGAPTSWGAKPFESQTFDTDANVIRRLHDAGAILLGKAAMIELAGGMGYRFGTASISGGAKNPWDERCWTCGSSSGSGAIVAASLAAFAIGTETWGSIVCPSTYTGISGLRPTFGRVGRSGAMALSYSMDKIGPMARSAADCAAVLNAISGHDAGDRGSLPESSAKFQHEPPMRRLRIGRVTNAWASIDPEIGAITDRAFAAMKGAGAEIVEVTLPDGPWEVAAGVTIQVEGASAFDTLIDSGGLTRLTDPGSRIGGYINQTVSGADYLRAQRLRLVIQRKMDAMFDDVDLLAAASLPIAATTMETNLETDLAFSDPLGGIGNFVGLPAISVPSGFTSKRLPAGIQFVGRVLDDSLVVAAAEEFQRVTKWHLERPASSRS